MLDAELKRIDEEALVDAEPEPDNVALRDDLSSAKDEIVIPRDDCSILRDRSCSGVHYSAWDGQSPSQCLILAAMNSHTMLLKGTVIVKVTSSDCCEDGVTISVIVA